MSCFFVPYVLYIYISIYLCIYIYMYIYIYYIYDIYCIYIINHNIIYIYIHLCSIILYLTSPWPWMATLAHVGPWGVWRGPLIENKNGSNSLTLIESNWGKVHFGSVLDLLFASFWTSVGSFWENCWIPWGDMDDNDQPFVAPKTFKARLSHLVEKQPHCPRYADRPQPKNRLFTSTIAWKLMEFVDVNRSPSPEKYVMS